MRRRRRPLVPRRERLEPHDREVRRALPARGHAQQRRRLDRLAARRREGAERPRRHFRPQQLRLSLQPRLRRPRFLRRRDRRREIARRQGPHADHGRGDRRAVTVTLRTHRIGDVGWVIHRHAILYAQDYGWNGEFEAMVAGIGAQFIRDFDPAREVCWIAEIDGRIVGSAFVVRQDDEVAKLRLVYVEPSARGQGVGRQLVRAAIGFAREKGYRRMTLWTNDILHAARRIYETEGFSLVAEERHHSFGVDLVGQNWERGL
ncbi:MAG: GNAT family N-acetyltransferase [Methylobacteriaceae bacterium]|nr:GNAT family N-acetyltransferase [Methylobacteriaceae bacterium]